MMASSSICVYTRRSLLFFRVELILFNEVSFPTIVNCSNDETPTLVEGEVEGGRSGGGVVLLKEISFPIIANCCVDGQHSIVVGEVERLRGGGGKGGGTGVDVILVALVWSILHRPLI
jgi:hypothetical protein